MGDYSKVGGQNADILRATINGETYNEQPTSEISELLLELKDKIEQGGGGGGGTTNYNALSNKPQINGVTLENSKTTEELGINIPSKTSEITNDSGFITNTVNNLTNYMKTSDINTALNSKANQATTYTKTEVDTALDLKADKNTTYTKAEVDTALGEKVNKETGKGLSANDFTNALKSKLDNIEAFANVNKINTIKVNGTPLTPDANKAVDIVMGAGGDNVFIAQQNTTPAGDLIQAYEANKIILISTPPTKETYSYIVQNFEKISDTQCMLSTVYIGTENFADGAKFRKFTVTNTTWSMSEWLPQPKLISGANIKTVNGESLLGSGDLPISGGTSNLNTVLTNGNTSSKTIILNHSTGVSANMSGGGIQITPDPNHILADKASLTSINGLMLEFKDGSDDFLTKLTSESFYMGGKPSSSTEYEHFEISPGIKKVTFTSGLAEAFKVALGLSNVTLQDVFRNSLNEYGESSCYIDKHGNFFFNFYDGLCLDINSRNEEIKMDSLSTENTISSTYKPGKISLVTDESAVSTGYAAEANSFEVDTANGTVTLSPGIAAKFKEALSDNYEVCVEDVGGNVVKVGTIKEDNANYGIYEFYYRTSSLAATATATAYPLSNILANYNVHDFIDATGITSNGIFIGNGRTDNDNRLIVQQFSKNNKTVTLRTYQSFAGNTALLKIKFIGTKNN